MILCGITKNKTKVINLKFKIFEKFYRKTLYLSNLYLKYYILLINYNLNIICIGFEYCLMI